MSPRRREYAKLPGYRHPDAAARRSQGASPQVQRWRRAGGTGFQRAGGAKGKLTEAQAAELEEVQGLPDTVPRVIQAVVPAEGVALYQVTPLN
ncbi:MAG TPA: hypothetical protein VJ305_22940 [Streptosporangiaceae bacterium]|nr:hypothetical protein [Streptosporangiaceae bacterium]